jgi:hypothetical protein
VLGGVTFGSSRGLATWRLGKMAYFYTPETILQGRNDYEKA